MSRLRYEWPGATAENIPLIEKFERELLPFLEKYGPYIGEMAQEGHPAAEEIILRHNGFQHGMPEARQFNFDRLVLALKAWKSDWEMAKLMIEKMNAGAAAAGKATVH